MPVQLGNEKEQWLTKVDQYLAEISDDTVYDAKKVGWDVDAAFIQYPDPYIALESLLEFVDVRS